MNDAVSFGCYIFRAAHERADFVGIFLRQSVSCQFDYDPAHCSDVDAGMKDYGGCGSVGAEQLVHQAKQREFHSVPASHEHAKSRIALTNGNRGCGNLNIVRFRHGYPP